LINNVKIEYPRVDYEYNGEIKELRYEVIWRENQEMYHAYIHYGARDKKFSINPTKISQWVQYNRLMNASDLFLRFNGIRFKEMSNIMKIEDKSYLSFYGPGKGSLGVSNAKLLLLEKDKITPYEGDIPVRASWYLIQEMRPSGPNSFESCNSHYFLFDIQEELE